MTCRRSWVETQTGSLRQAHRMRIRRKKKMLISKRRKRMTWRATGPRNDEKKFVDERERQGWSSKAADCAHLEYVPC